MRWPDGTGRFAYHLNEMSVQSVLPGIGIFKLCPARTWLQAPFFLEGSIQFGSENGRRQLPAVFGDDAYLRWSSCSATHDGSGIIYITCIKKLDTIERDYHFT